MTIDDHCVQCGLYIGLRSLNGLCLTCIYTPEVLGEIDPAGKSACKPASALSTQEGGDHYKNLKIQPVEYIHANGLGFIEGSVIKYVTRWRSKNGIADLRKARHFIDLLIELEGSE